jgi:hypothetical protein
VRPTTERTSGSDCPKQLWRIGPRIHPSLTTRVYPEALERAQRATAVSFYHKTKYTRFRPTRFSEVGGILKDDLDIAEVVDDSKPERGSGKYLPYGTVATLTPEEAVAREKSSNPAGVGTRVDSAEREVRRHPSRSLDARRSGFGIGGGYEKPYKPKIPSSPEGVRSQYGPISEGGYYGAGNSFPRFKVGQAGFQSELAWYHKQFGEKTSRYED